MNFDSNPPESAAFQLRGQLNVRVFGVGGAGGNAIGQLVLAGLEGVQCVAVNTDAQALTNVLGADQLHLGAKLMRGLGAGGDPSLGQAAAESDAERLKEQCAGIDLVFILAGLGGGTGTGASPVVARMAREAGALVVAVVTLPFECEGSRRRRQAQLGLEQLKAAADVVICLPNQKVLAMIDENTSLADSFYFTNELLIQGVRGIWRLVTRTGLINLDFADLCGVLRGRHAEGFCAAAEARGTGRARDVVEKLLAHPLLDAGRVLGASESVLVSIVGGPDLSLGEVTRVMEQINRHCESAHVTLGATIEPDFGDRLAITLVASQPAMRQEASEDEAEAPAPSRSIGSEFFQRTEVERPASRFVPPAPDATPERTEQLLSQQTPAARRSRKSSRMRQAQLPLDIVSKGRFEKSEPTIHKGEDLDVPTYIRRGVALN